ncbi:MAG: polymer-forming cytoskeletal protein [Polyangiaceae bacterium]
MGWLSKKENVTTPLPAATPLPLPRALEVAKPAALPAPVSPNTIAKGTFVRGDLRGDGGFLIHGRVDGSVESGGPVVIGEEGAVSGLVRGTHVTVDGVVEGDVHATGHLEVGARGRLIGDATAKSVRVAEGGAFRGMCRMGDDAASSSDAPAISSPLLSANVTSGERWPASDVAVDALANGTDAD